MMHLEGLEPRRLFAGDPTFELTSKGTLIVHGSLGNDSVDIGFLHNKPEDGLHVVAITLDGTLYVTHDFRTRFSNVKRITVDTGAGNDDIFLGGGADMTRPAQLLGGGGKDHINFSASGAILAAGGTGADVIGKTAVIVVSEKKNSEALKRIFAIGNTTGVCTIQGGGGNDVVSGDTNDVIDGGGGNDSALIGVVGNGISLTQARLNALAKDYYTRTGAVSIEIFQGTNLLTGG